MNTDKFIQIEGVNQTFKTAKGLFPALCDIHLNIAKGELATPVARIASGIQVDSVIMPDEDDDIVDDGGDRLPERFGRGAFVRACALDCIGLAPWFCECRDDRSRAGVEHLVRTRALRADGGDRRTRRS